MYAGEEPICTCVGVKGVQHPRRFCLSLTLSPFLVVALTMASDASGPQDFTEWNKHLRALTSLLNTHASQAATSEVRPCHALKDACLALDVRVFTQNANHLR